MLSMIANPVTALPVGYPRSGLSRSDLVLWPAASDVAVQANVGFGSTCGSDRRALKTSKMTRSKSSTMGHVSAVTDGNRPGPYVG